jgi:ATP adenylyltransferase
MNDILYSPWRLKYILSEKENKCIFCDRPSKAEDEKHLILYRSQFCFVIMNMYPYNNGHLMVVPYQHTSSLTELSKDEIDNVFETVQLCESVLRRNYNPDGINIGMNIGKEAGAGIDEHIHVHILPRWSGDVNFFSVIGGTRVVPEAFETAYIQLKEQFDNARVKK